MDFFSTNNLIEPQKGDLLISEPYLMDPNFNRTVIYLCEHNEDGSFGLVLNRKARLDLNDVLDDVGNYGADLFIGGPVEQDTLHFIHRDQALAADGKEVKNGIYWGGDFERLLQLMNINSIKNENIRFFVGYSGWSPGQLINELREKSWIVLKGATPEMIFEWDNQDLWEECLRTMGGKFRLISNYPKDPRMN